MSRRTPILAALLLALWPVGLRAAAVRSAPLYPAAAAPWSAAIGGALQMSPGASPLAPALMPLTAPALIPGSGYAPVVAQLESALKLTPAAFAALPEDERRVTLELAVEAAQSDLTQKVYELAAQAKSLSAPDKGLDKGGRAELYRVVAQLDELRTRYGPLMTPQEVETVSDSYGRAAGRAWSIRAALLGQNAKALGAALAGAGRDSPAAVAAAPMPPASGGARALADDMRNNAVGWRLNDLDRLLIGYGFTLNQGGKHRKYEYPGLKPEIVPRHTAVDPNYIKSALAAIDVIEARRARASAPAPSAAERAAPPAQINLDDLAILLAEEPKKPEHAPAKAAPAPATKGTPVAAAPSRTLADAARLQPAAPRPEPEAKPEPPAPEPPAPGAFQRVKGWLRNPFGPR